MVITDRGKPAHVLMTYADFERITGKGGNLLEALSMHGLSEIDLSPERVHIAPREVDLT